MLNTGVLIQINSLYFSPMWPVKKSNGLWILTTDYYSLNKVVSSIATLILERHITYIQRCNKPKGISSYGSCLLLIPILEKESAVCAVTWEGSLLHYWFASGLFELPTLLLYFG